jgi:hypothetical protein
LKLHIQEGKKQSKKCRKKQIKGVHGEGNFDIFGNRKKRKLVFAIRHDE